jgi:hypothetical protein
MDGTLALDHPLYSSSALTGTLLQDAGVDIIELDKLRGRGQATSASIHEKRRRSFR